MHIYRFVTTIPTTGGTGSANTNPIIGGLCRQLLIRAQTSGTTFQANVTDDESEIVRAYDPVRTRLIDDWPPLIVQGVYTIQITGASADGTFTVEMAVQE